MELAPTTRTARTDDRSEAGAIGFEGELLAGYPALVRRLTLVLRDAAEAEDVAQATVVRALERRGRFDGRDVRAWFYTIGLRLAFNELRRRKRRIVESSEPTWAMASEPDLWLALGQLEPQHRAALLLSTLDGYTHDEVGRILGVRAGTVSSWLSRTKARLRVLLGEPDDD
ncbi:MAG TPA: RNA polymerase sigma factor [Candidatus Limnocylindrales bacterium]|nr:RNA polymerase sigma factor [Candidatus Limnocylindrales bacterium]